MLLRIPSLFFRLTLELLFNGWLELGHVLRRRIRPERQLRNRHRICPTVPQFEHCTPTTYLSFLAYVDRDSDKNLEKAVNGIANIIQNEFPASRIVAVYVDGSIPLLWSP